MTVKFSTFLLYVQAIFLAESVSAGGLPAGAAGVSELATAPSGALHSQFPSAATRAPAGDAIGHEAEEGEEFESASPPLPSGCTFFLVRHGESKPNVAGKIVSGMDGGVDPANGLTGKGLEQARRAGKDLKEVMLHAGCLPANTMVLSSPFSRARETAEAIRDCLDCELREERDLRERWFGDLDGRDAVPSYQKVWALDAVSARHGELGVEPAAVVAERAAAVVDRVRKEVSIRQRYHTGDGQPFPPGPSAVVLVSHGDSLQLLQCLLAGRPLEEHRSLPHLENCGIRALRPPPEGGGEEPGEETGSGEHRGDTGKGFDAAFRMSGARLLRRMSAEGKGEESDGGGEFSVAGQ